MADTKNLEIHLITSKNLQKKILSGTEIALLDVREEGIFSRQHLLMARSLPLSRLELGIRDLVPRLATPIVLCDGNDGLAERAESKLKFFGYQNVEILSGGIQAWHETGFTTFEGVGVPSKAFGEFVETAYETPSITAETLKSLIDSGSNLLVLDSRPYGEYHRGSIPTAVDTPGAELVHRIHDLVPNADTLVVVNCAGRTRSIIGCQSLINAGIKNQVVALKNGTMGWRLAGYDLDYNQKHCAPNPTPKGLAKAQECAKRVAERFGVQTINRQTFDEWLGESNSRSLYVFDVRSPEEYEAGHLSGTVSAPGGQLVQSTDRFVGTLNSRIVLIDNDEVRAIMTASWLRQMGWSDTVVLGDAFEDSEIETGEPEPKILGLDQATPEMVTPEMVAEKLSDDSCVIVDLATSRSYHTGHIAGSWFIIRSRLPENLKRLPSASNIILTSEDGQLAKLAAAEIQADTATRVSVLSGGTEAWSSAGHSLVKGFENLADETDDVNWRPDEVSNDPKSRMRDYLKWEIGLVEQVKQDGTMLLKRYS